MEGWRMVRYVLPVIMTCALAAACADKKKPTSRPATVKERQDQALREPFEYGPDPDMPDVTGGDTGQLDKKGVKRDWDRFWNP